MTDRDFKLLVREYFQAKSRLEYCDRTNFGDYSKKKIDLEKRILSELEDFTRRDVEELPFKETEI